MKYIYSMLNRTFLLCSLWMACGSLSGQIPSCVDSISYQRSMMEAKNLISADDYSAAYEKLNVARDYCEDSSEVIQKAQDDLFIRINKLREDADRLTRRLLRIYKMTLADSLAADIRLEKISNNRQLAYLCLAIYQLKKETKSSYFSQDSYDAFYHSMKQHFPFTQVDQPYQFLYVDQYHFADVAFKRSNLNNLIYSHPSSLTLGDGLSLTGGAKLQKKFPILINLNWSLMQISCNGQWLLLASDSPFLRLYSLLDSSDHFPFILYQPNMPIKKVFPIPFENGNSFLIVRGMDDSIEVLRINASSREVASDTLGMVPVFSNAMSKKIYYQHLTNGDIWVRDSTTFIRLNDINPYLDSLMTYSPNTLLTISNDGQWLALGSNNQLEVYNLTKELPQQRISVSRNWKSKQLHFSQYQDEVCLLSLSSEGKLSGYYDLINLNTSVITLGENVDRFMITPDQKSLILIESDIKEKTISYQVPIHFKAMIAELFQQHQFAFQEEEWTKYVREDISIKPNFNNLKKELGQ